MNFPFQSEELYAEVLLDVLSKAIAEEINTTLKTNALCALIQ